MQPIVLGGIALPSDLAWVDEFAWTPVEQTSSYTLDGSLVLEQATRQAGRPLTLKGAEDRAWVTRQTLLALYALAQAPSAGMALQLADLRSFTVVWRHGETAIEAEPVTRVSPPEPGDYYSVTLRLMTV